MRLGLDTFRHAIRRQRPLVLAFLLVELFTLVDGRNFVQAYQVHEEKEARLSEVSETLGIPIEQLRPEHEGLFDRLGGFFGDSEEDPVKVAGQQRLQEVLAHHAEAVANNPYRPQIEAVEQEQRIHRVEGLLDGLRQLTAPGSAGKALSEGAQKALLRGLHHGLERGLLLPDPIEGLPTKALDRRATLQQKLDRLAENVRPIVADTQDKAMQGTLAQKAEQLRLFHGAEVERRQRPPRFADRPLPTRRVERKARSIEATAARADQKPVRLPRPAPRSSDQELAKAAKSVAPQVTALAQELGNSPAKMLTFVREQVDYDPKWGASKSPAGTLEEGLGTSWDQAWLLQQLLTAAGVDARFEWGQVEITPEQLTNLVGTDDPWRAADLLTTAGNPVVLLTAGSQVVAVRMEHAWVKAHLDYVPDRGMRNGPGDTWVAMDPTLVSIRWSEGLRVHESVPFTLESYLTSGTELSPRRFYEEALWSHIRANDIQCTTLEQLKRSGTVEHETVPFVPGTLKAEVIRLDGQATAVPSTMQYGLSMTVRTSEGTQLLSWSSPWPAVYAQRLELAWPGATTDDQTTIDGYGGLFETPPYLVELAPQVRLGGATTVTGNAVGAALDVEVEVVVSSPGSPARSVVHHLVAGERSVLALELGSIADEAVSRAQAASAADQALSAPEALHLIASTYLRDLSRDLTELAAWRWERLVRLGTEVMVVQTTDVGTTVAGSPLSWQRAERFIDVAANDLGLFHSEGTSGGRLQSAELLGTQGSFLEGAVFPASLGRPGIAAVTALTRAVREGQTLLRVDQANLVQVLADIDLGAEIEADIEEGVLSGQVAWVPGTPIQLNLWDGVGYILEDPTTGSTAYLLSGGYAGGADVGPAEVLQELLGSEPWWTNGPLKPLFDVLLSIVDAVALPEEPQSIQGDPVNLATGNFLTTVTDVYLMAPAIPIGFARTYNSRSDRMGLFGKGWSHSYGEALEPVDGGMLFLESDGSEHFFPLEEQGFGTVVGKHLELTEIDTGYELRTQNGEGLVFSAEGRLLARENRFGHRVEVEYGSGGELLSIRDINGQVALSFEYVDGKLVALTDHSGRSVSYGYDGSENLAWAEDLDGGRWLYAYDAEGNMTSIVNPSGSQDTYLYDSSDRLVQHIDRGGSSEYFAYGEGHRSAIVTDRRGHTRYFEMDSQGRAVLAVDPLGNTQRAAWDSENNRTEYVDSRGARYQRFYDSSGQLTQEIDPLGRSKSFTYDGTQLVSMTDADGKVISVEYDARGLPSTSRMEVGSIVLEEAFQFNDVGQMVGYTDSNGATTQWEYDLASGAMIREVSPTGAERLYEIDALGRGVRAHGSGQSELGLTWEGSSRVREIRDSLGYRVTASFDALNRLVGTESVRGTTSRAYDPMGNMVLMQDELGSTTRYEYDAEGNRITEIDPLGHRKETIYDALGRPIASIDPRGGVWTFGHCSAMQATEQGLNSCASGNCRDYAPLGGENEFCDITDPLGNSTRRDYDIAGNVVRQVDPLGGENLFEYDAANRLTSIQDPMGRRTQFEYDLAGRQTAVVEANEARTEYVYGRGSLLTEIIDANGNQRSFEYDTAGRMIAEIDALGNTTEMSYHPLGMLTEKRLPSGGLISYQYDDTRLIETTFGGEAHQFGYDDLGRRVSAQNATADLSFEYDAKNRLVREENDTLGEVITHGYDAASNRLSTTVGDRRLTYHYGSRNELVEMIDSRSGTYRFKYDELGRRTRLHYPNGTETRYHYDALGRTQSLVTVRVDGEVIDGFAYQYDLAGNVLSRASLRDGGSETFEYDTVDRLVSWSRGAETKSYEYDAVGNRVRLLGPDRETTYAYDVANRLLSEMMTGASTAQILYAWDADGRQVRKESSGSVTTYDYDLLGNLTQVTEAAQSISWGYDPLGRRFREQTSAGTSHFLTSGENVVAEIRAGGRRIDFTHGPWIDEVFSESVVTPDEGLLPSTYYHHDDLGSVTSWSDDSGQRSGYRSYAPFGSEVAAQGGIEGRYGFTGREADPTGLYHYRARSYNPQTGRFTSVDPVGSQFLAPMTLNGFDYAFGNPLKYRDPSGESPISFIGKALLGLTVGAVIAGASVNCVLSGAGADCALLLMASFIPAASTSGALAAWALSILGLIFLAAQLWDYYRSGDLHPLAAITLFVILGTAGYVWAFHSWLFVAALATSGFNLMAGTEGVVALVLLSGYAAIAYWVIQVFALKKEISFE